MTTSVITLTAAVPQRLGISHLWPSLMSPLHPDLESRAFVTSGAIVPETTQERGAVSAKPAGDFLVKPPVVSFLHGSSLSEKSHAAFCSNGTEPTHSVNRFPHRVGCSDITEGGEAREVQSHVLW